MCVYAAYDYWRHKQRATRWKEYLFIVSCGVIAAVLGVMNDSLTVRISPAYFVYGKGLEGGDGLIFRAQCLGAQAGMVAGLLIGGVLLLTTGVEAPFKSAYKWVAFISVTGLLVACLGHFLIPVYMQSSNMLHALALSEADQFGFYQVWGVHLGFYAGAVVALILAIILLRRQLRRERLTD